MMQNEFYRLAFQMLSLDEGVQRRPYDDATGKVIKAPEGNVTIGVGHNLDANPISNAVMLALLTEDVNEAIQAAKEILGSTAWDQLSLNRKLGLINLTFSVGGSGLRRFKKMIAAIIRKDWSTVGQELGSSLWTRQVNRNKTLGKGRDYRVIKLLKDDEYEY